MERGLLYTNIDEIEWYRLKISLINILATTLTV